MIKLEVDVDRIYEDFAPSYLRHTLIYRWGHKSKSKSICECLPIWQVSYSRNINFWQFLGDIFKKEYVISLFQYVNLYDRNVLEFVCIYWKRLHYLKFFEWQNRNKHWRKCDTVWTQHNNPPNPDIPKVTTLLFSLMCCQKSLCADPFPHSRAHRAKGRNNCDGWW